MYEIPDLPQGADPPTWILNFIWIAAALVFVIYRFQAGSSIFDSLFKKRRNDEEKELEDKVSNYLEKHRTILSDEDKAALERYAAVPPKLHLLKVVKTDEQFLLYFYNEGGEVFNLEIKSNDIPSIEIEPHEKLSNKESGYIKVHNDIANYNAIKFKLNYLDQRKEKATKKYKYYVSDERLEEVSFRF